MCARVFCEACLRRPALKKKGVGAGQYHHSIQRQDLVSLFHASRRRRAASLEPADRDQAAPRADAEGHAQSASAAAATSTIVVAS